MTPVIDIAGLSLGCAAGNRILRDITWTVNPGEHWVILGPNGSGKTSLLSAITGYLHETAGIPSGKLGILGQTYGHCDWRELRKKVGIVSSGVRNLVPDDHTALGVVAGGKQALLQLWDEPSASEIREARRRLRLTECAALEDRAWAVLSQGERQRVLIARALMAKPKLLILDEPCAGLDPVAREAFLASLARLARARRGPGLVLVTHHVEEIVAGFTHALLLRRGTVLAAGPLGRTLTAAKLTATFGHPVRVRRRAGRWQLRIVPAAPR